MTMRVGHVPVILPSEPRFRMICETCGMYFSAQTAEVLVEHFTAHQEYVNAISIEETTETHRGG